MTRRSRNRSALLVLATAAIAFWLVADRNPSVAAPQAGGFNRAYLATLVDLAGRLPRTSTAPVKIWIDRLTSDDEAAQFSALARAKGPEAVDKALLEDTVGRLQIGDRTADPIAFARRFPTPDGEHLILISQRPISFREIFGNTRSRDYPYTVVELDLDASGRGSGEVLLAARLQTQKNGEIELENLDFISGRLMAVQPLDD